MILLAIDGNSIVNRAFYGIKMLATKDGRFTNGIYGFLNILLHLREKYAPDAIAVAFDLKAPTFRHKMYDGYKAGRKGMPPELREQMPVLKSILHDMGIQTVETAGFEADDLLGTLSVGDCTHCYIATGDRDSLQLISDKTTVLLTSTKMGRTETTEYDRDRLLADYAMTPEKMIDLKALMGDASDNIPGVPGIGQKTATDLIVKYGSLDDIYRDLDALELTKSVRAKLENGRESAYLSRTLGTICREAPIETRAAAYAVTEGNPAALRNTLISLEMYKMAERLGLSAEQSAPASDAQPGLVLQYQKNADSLSLCRESGCAYLCVSFEGDAAARFAVCNRQSVTEVTENVDACLSALLRETPMKIFTDASKTLHRYALAREIEIAAPVFDCEIAGYLLNPNASDYSVQTAAADLHVACPTIDGMEEPSALVRCAALLPVVADKLTAQLETNGQEMLFYEVELPLAKVLASMELLGFKVDESGIRQFGDALQARIESLVEQIYAEAGETFNLNSPKQLGVILFEKMGLPAKKKTKTGYSTNAEVLESLAEEYPVVADILEYRTLSKLKSTYCEGLLKVIGGDGRIHSTFHQTETRTGRISSAEPNLQNIPVRSDLGREMRRFFVADQGYTLADADYSQIELRVLADLANDETMLAAFNQGEDIHTATAAQVFGLPPEMITANLRSRAKAVNFGIVYGIGAFSLAKDIGVSRFEADKYIKAYLAHYAGVDRYMKTVIETAKEKGYSETIFHRRRYLPELAASNAIQRAFGERVARNMPIQGTAADIIKIAMVRVYNRLRREGLRSRLILQVHDELIVETAAGEEAAVAALLSEEMEHAVQLKVAMIADVHFGDSWYDAKG